MMEPMTSSRSSKVTTLVLLCVLALSVAVPAAAVSVDTAEVPEEAEAGTQVSASVTLDTLYQEPQWEQWTLQGETELENVTWTVTFIDASGNQFDTKSYDGQTFEQPDITSDRDPPIIGLRVEVVGEVPPPAEFTYPDKESFVTMDLTQARGEEGSMNDIGTWVTHHYTTGAADEPGSREARQAIASAEGAIQQAEAADADTTTANQSLGNAIEFYQAGQFANTVENANTAEEQANEAREDAESSQQTTQLLMYAGLVAVVLALLGGGFWYYQQQQDSYDKLG